MKSKLRSLLTYLIGWPLSIVALFIIIRIIWSHANEISLHLQTINYTLIGIGFFCFVVYYLARSYVYQKILNFLGYPLSFKDTAFHWGQSEIHRYIPGNVWTFLGRTVLFSKKNVDKKDITLSFIVEGQLVVLGTIIVTLLGMPLITKTFLSQFPLRPYLSMIAVCGSILLILLYLSFTKAKRFVKQPFLQKILFSPFSPRENLILIGISALCYLFFGLGYYFVMSGISLLPLQLIWVLTGFFAFSLLVGYVSFITPTGLGIREGVLFLGLQNLVSGPVVGFASIFTRVILILSEVLFLGIVYLWHRTKNISVVHFEHFISKRKAVALLSIGILLYTTYFTTTTFLRYTNFYTGRFDLGNMAQTVWNTSHGDIFRLTDPNGTEEVSRLAYHADFILALLAPFYWIWSDPRMLLLIQTVVVAVGSIFVFLLARKVLKGSMIPLILSWMYLLNPSIQRANLYDFHAVTLATTFLLAAFYFLSEKKYRWFLLLLFLAALTKEQVWLIVTLFGGYITLFFRKYLLGSILMVVGVVIFGFLLFYAIPHAANSPHFALSYYSDYGDSPSSIIENIILSPQKTIPIIFQHDQRLFLKQIFGPVGYLALLSPLYLIFASGDLIIDLLSSNAQLHQIYYQYTAIISPFVFIATIFGIKRLFSLFPNLPKEMVAVYLCAVSIYSAYLYGPLPGAKESNLAMYTNPYPNAKSIDTFFAGLPSEYSIAASNNLGSHLSHREKIYTIPTGIDKADIIALLPDSTTQYSDETAKKIITTLRFDPNYFVLMDKDGFIVFKKITK